MKALNQYLQRYAEIETEQLAGFTGHYQHAIVIPIYRESLDCLKRFIAWIEQQGNTLLVMVLNRPDSDSKTDWCQSYYQQCSLPVWTSKNQQLQLFSQANNSGLLFIDRCINGPAIPKDQGVGLARKIGADIVCRLISQQGIQCPWIFNTDADVTLPDNYFSTVAQTNANCAAIIYPFQHSFDDDKVPTLPTLLYEFSLHYYVAGLTWAGSPYAYHTLGSTIAIEHRHYAKVRGFPKRSGAEDFYLLNKLAKTGQIDSLQKPSIQIAARESTRVPFGTGPAVKRLAESKNLLAMPLYHPDSFLYLKAFLNLLLRSTVQDQLKPIEYFLDEIAQEYSKINTEHLLHFYEQFNVQKALQHSFRQGKTAAARRQHLQHWFDGFKTLKLIHFLRDNYLGMTTYQEWQKNYLTYPYHNQRTMTLVEQIKSAHRKNGY